ncbi:hypothetical protein HNV11_17640 [Spirosoma taeanense]|uniref:DUF4352 domain-containing protein n=1 Tax=Spirosoma taeanense TaxID=2735870 RepID=A0A6M5YA54_9BACT|nr:hypothetical protein [Spirosoma taeanense]QJW91067.1 hypothetical protein HNV11_17640 [Spirosoma taeanense]
MNAHTPLLAATLLLSACQPADEKEIGLRELIHHDDFVYSVRQVTVQDSIGSLKPKGRFWIVTFRVDNQAVRIAHPWGNNTPYVRDPGGKVYENLPKAQQRLNQLRPFGWRSKYKTPARQSDSTRLVFDLPKTVRQPYLQVRGEVLLGDVLDRRQFKRTKVRLF